MDRLNQAPSDDDWGEIRDQDDLDEKWSRNHYMGRTLREKMEELSNSPLSYTEDLRAMPEIPFCYFILGFKEALYPGPEESDFNLMFPSDTASCFLSLVEETLQKSPKKIMPVMHEILPLAKYVSENQELYEANPDNYGNFVTLYQEIEQLYIAQLHENM